MKTGSRSMTDLTDAYRRKISDTISTDSAENIAPRDYLFDFSLFSNFGNICRTNFDHFEIRIFHVIIHLRLKGWGSAFEDLNKTLSTSDSLAGGDYRSWEVLSRNGLFIGFQTTDIVSQISEKNAQWDHTYWWSYPSIQWLVHFHYPYRKN